MTLSADNCRMRNYCKGHEKNCSLLIDSYTEQSDVNALLSASENYMLEEQEAREIVDEVRDAIKDWRKIAEELRISPRLLGTYSMRWDAS